MASITEYTNKISGQVASFYQTPYGMPVKNFKVNFTPSQSGTPSPDNICPIESKTEIEGFSAGKNLAHVVGYSAITGGWSDTRRKYTNGWGTVINTIDYSLPDSSVTITQSEVSRPEDPANYRNGYVSIWVDNLIFGRTYNVSFKATNVVNNLLNTNLSDIKINAPNASSFSGQVKGNRIVFNNVIFRPHPTYPDAQFFDVNVCGMSFTLSEFMVTEVSEDATKFEPYQGACASVTLPHIGKNLYDCVAYPMKRGWVSGGGGGVDFSDSVSHQTTIDFIPFSGFDGQTITLNKRPGGTNPGIAFYSDAKTEAFIGGEKNLDKTAGLPMTTVVPEGTKYMRFTVPLNAKVEEVQIELGSESTEYEPYIHLLPGGSVDLMTGEIVQDWYEYVLTGNETYYTTGNWIITYVPYNGLQAARPYQGFCTHYPYAPYSAGSVGIMYNERTITLPASLRDQEGWVAYIKEQYNAGTPIRIVYKLKDPIIRCVDPYSEEIKTVVGNNYFWSKEDSVEVEYYLHDGDKMWPRLNQIVKNEPHIATASGDVCTFHTDMVAPMRDCKVYFSPVQAGSGDPTPDNIRAISGITKLTLWASGKNMAEVVGYSASTTTDPRRDRDLSNAYGTSINTIDFIHPDSSVIVTQTEFTTDYGANHYRNGFFAVILQKLVYDQQYYVSFRITDIVSNPLNWDISKISIGSPGGNEASPMKVVGDRVIYKIDYKKHPNYNNCQYFYIRCCGMSYTLSEFMVTPVDEDTTFAEHKQNTIQVRFPSTSINLINPVVDNVLYLSGYNKYNLSNGVVTTYGNTYMGFIAAVKPNTEYSFSVITSSFAGNTLLRVWEFSSYPSNIANYLKLTSRGWVDSFSITTTENTQYVVAGVYTNDQAAKNGVIFSDFRLEEGSIPSSTVYGGHFDLIKGKLVAEWADVQIKNCNVTLNSNTTDAWHNWGVFLNAGIPKTMTGGAKTELYAISDTFIGTPQTGSDSILAQDQSLPIMWQSVVDGSFRIKYQADCALTASEFKAKYGDAHICYRLAEPIEYQLTPAQFQTYRGSNSVWSDANGEVDVTYWKHGDVALTRVAGDGYETSDGFLIATSDGFILGEEANYVEY